MIIRPLSMAAATVTQTPLLSTSAPPYPLFDSLELAGKQAQACLPRAYINLLTLNHMGDLP